MLGSAIKRIKSEEIVMPSCAVANINETFSIAAIVIFAGLLPASARGSICARRALIRANSEPTKKALESKRTTSQTSP